MHKIKKAAAAIYGWDRPLLTFIYPSFEHVAMAWAQLPMGKEPPWGQQVWSWTMDPLIRIETTLVPLWRYRQKGATKLCFGGYLSGRTTAA